ncbi:hypothetical protein V5O48_011060, partial [Marasmius crinis-equi]
SSVGLVGCFIRNDWPVFDPPRVCKSLIISSFTLSMATNISGTILVGYKAWQYCKNVKTYLDHCRRKTRAEKMLVLLFESGVVYSILYIAQLVVVLMPEPATLSGQVVYHICSSAFIMLLVELLVQLQEKSPPKFLSIIVTGVKMAETETTADLQFVSLLGKTMTLSVASLIIETFFYGTYMLLFCVSAVILCRREGNSKARIVLLIATTVMFFMSSFQMWSDVVVVLRNIQSVFIDDVGVPFMEKQAAFGKKFRLLGSVEGVANTLEASIGSYQISLENTYALVSIQIVLGDTIVFWRVWTLCGGHLRLVFVPFLFLLGTAGCVVQHNWPLANPPTCNALIISAYSLSMATNLSGTFVIGYKVWLYRKDIGAYLSKYKQPARAETILILLLETGIIYSVLWLIQLVIVRSPPPSNFAGKILQQGLRAATVQLMGLYPTLLIVIIYLQRSMWDHSGNSTIISGLDTHKSDVMELSRGDSTLTAKNEKMDEA